MRDTKDTQNLCTYPQSSVASTMKRCGLEGSGFEPMWLRHFTYPERPALGPTQPLVQMIQRLFPEGKEAGA